MTFRVEFTEVADMEAQEILLWLLGRSPEYAGRWQNEFESAVKSLEQFPTRCPYAPENAAFDAEVRQLRFGSYRILFTILAAEDEGSPGTVRLLHIRHIARRWLTDEGDRSG